MEDRMEVIVHDGRLFISMDDLHDDVLRQYNDEFRTPEEARCALKVIRWMEALLRHHQKDLEPQNLGNETLWSSNGA